MKSYLEMDENHTVNNTQKENCLKNCSNFQEINSEEEKKT
jgi:hypothetical protein